MRAAATTTTDARLSAHTTLRLGGRASRLLRTEGADEVVDAVGSADAAGEPVLLVGGGSNLVVADDGFDGTAVLLAGRGLSHERDGDTVAEISKKWFRVRDAYGVDVAPGEDAPLILAITVAIDSLTTRD